MKRKCWLLLLMAMFLLAMGCGDVSEKKISVEEQKEQYEKEEKETMSVNEQIGILIDSEEFMSATKEQRKAMAEALIKRLLTEGELVRYDFDERKGLYSFEDKNGIHGGILLEEFPSYMN